MVPSFFPMAIFRRFLVVEHHYAPHQKLRGAPSIEWGLYKTKRVYKNPPKGTPSFLFR